MMDYSKEFPIAQPPEYPIDIAKHQEKTFIEKTGIGFTEQLKNHPRYDDNFEY